MTEERKKLIERFELWFSTNPNRSVLSSQCANIAEEYAREKMDEYNRKPLNNCGHHNQERGN